MAATGVKPKKYRRDAQIDWRDAPENQLTKRKKKGRALADAPL